MDMIIFTTYKAATKFPLIQLATYFNLKNDVSWKEFIKLKGKQIEKILMYESNEKYVYMYKYGCITFVNFRQHEIQYFLEYLTKLYIEIDNKLLTKYNETHIMTLTEDNLVTLWEDNEDTYQYNEILLDICATVLAKSIELYKIEDELKYILDDAGLLIKYLTRGRLRANTKKVISIMAKCTRYKYRSIESVRLLDRPPEFDKSIETREIFQVMSNFYELDDRYLAFSNRTDVLDSITEEYFELRNSRAERRLLMFEILLLAVFPLMHFIS